MSKTFLIDLVQFHICLFVFHCWLSWEKTCFDFIQNPRYQAHIHCASWLICHKKGLSMRRSFPKSILLMLRTMKINKDNCTSGRKYKLLLDFQGYSQSVKNRNKLGFSALGSILDASLSPCSTIFLPVFWPSSELGFLGFSYQGFGFFYQFILFYIFPLFLHNFLSLLFLVSFSDTGIMSCLLISHRFHKRNKLHRPWPSLSIFCSLWAYAEVLFKTVSVHWALIKPWKVENPPQK